jgi:energy-coupling factor transporter transmembrane protein EcfT
VSDLSNLLERVGLRGLGFATGVAVNMLPTIQESLVTSYRALRLRGGFRRRPWQGARLLLVKVIANSLRHADDIVGSAESRAFSVENAPSMRLSWSRSDVGAMSSLAVAILVLWLI